MLKSIGLFSVLGVALLVVASLPAEDPVKTCPGGSCGGAACAKAASKGCSGCPAAKATAQSQSPACTKNCEDCPAAKDCQKPCESCADGKSCAKGCEDCPAAKDCQKPCESCADGKSCAKGCGSCPAAGDTKPTSATACAGGDCPLAAAGKDCKDCPITAAMKALPQMTFVVGEEKTCCPKAAAALAEKSSAPIRYAVGDKSFDTEADAKVALAEVTERFVATFVEPKACKETGKVAVAGKELCCEKMAAQTAAVAKAAMDKVQMTYLVGEKECQCPNEAAKLAKESGDPTVYVVAGESTACSVTARINLARAKYKAAVVAVMQAEAPATETLTSKNDSAG
jgi:hypothetical protein